MKPFAGYNYADYWSHWISVGAKLKSPPQIFHVNWFRQNDAGKFLWPGYGENLRVLRWIIDRCKGTAEARDTAIGRLPNAADLDIQGLDLAPGALDELLAVNPKLWQTELASIGTYMAEFGERLPQELKTELAAALDRLFA
jgi:phosphoenolpyruvate carboxykinase (GTP)